jgi:hypothetical protein
MSITGSHICRRKKNYIANLNMPFCPSVHLSYRKKFKQNCDPWWQSFLLAAIVAALAVREISALCRTTFFSQDRRQSKRRTTGKI